MTATNLALSGGLFLAKSMIGAAVAQCWDSTLPLTTLIPLIREFVED